MEFKRHKLETVNENNCLTTNNNGGGGGAPGALTNVNNNNNGDSCTKLDSSGVAGLQSQNTPLLRAKFLQRKLAPVKRLVEKSGECNVSLCNVKRQKLKYVT
uniref:Uncharacterized protein n=1 Tax=Romanomermis culicivorax TaxID=13658 RepID=A0A915K8M0_ROMCU